MAGEMSVNTHMEQPAITRGASLAECRAIALLVHGRNQTTSDILEIAERIALPAVHYVALQAAGNSWYPLSFMAAITDNEPYLSQALECYDARVTELLANGVPRTKLVLLGFSQGACLTAEYAVRHAADRYGGIVLYTGGVIGPAGTQWEYGGSLQNTPVFLGSSDIDDWVPEARVRETEAVFRRMGADTTLRIYQGMDHVVNDDEIAFARWLLQRVQSAKSDVLS